MFDWKWLIAAVIGYFIGNIESAVIISRAAFRDDVRRHGSGNAGSTNMLRVFGIKAGALTFVCDFIKGGIAVLAGWLIGGTIGGYAAGVFAVIGHDFPVLFGMKGGKGVASSLAVAWLISPITAAVATVVAFALIFATRIVSIGSMTGILLFSVSTIIFNHTDTALIVTCAALALLVLVRHVENIARLIHGTETKLMPAKQTEKR